MASLMVFKSAEDELIAIQLTCNHDDVEADQSRARQLLREQTLQQLQPQSYVRCRLLIISMLNNIVEEAATQHGNRHVAALLA